MRDLVIYHAGCWDGFCAAWLMKQRKPDAEFMPANYGEAPPSDDQVKGKHVYILDFSYPRSVLERIYGLAESLVVLDHHKTAQKDLDGLPYCVFDMEKSGARLTHEYIESKIDRVNGIGTAPHWLVSYTEDRDLWKWELYESKAINEALRSYPLDFEVWDDIAKADPDELVVEGKAILRAMEQIVAAKVSQSHIVEVPAPGGFDLASCWWTKWKVANATTLMSETAGALAEETGVGCCWFEFQDGNRLYSLRAVKESNVDVSIMAKAFGGGGHAKAAGFKTMTHPWES